MVHWNGTNLDADLESSPVSIRNYQDTIDFETSLIKQMNEDKSKLKVINKSMQKNNNEKSEFSMANNQDKFIISRNNDITFENIYQNEEIEKYNLINKNNSNNNILNINNYLETNVNNLITLNSNYNSISHIEIFSNSLSKFSHNTSEILNHSTSYFHLFIMEKQVYLQLNSIRPNKSKLINQITDNEKCNPESKYQYSDKNYMNHNEKCELENITEYIDLENMSSINKSSISDTNSINLNNLNNNRNYDIINMSSNNVSLITSNLNEGILNSNNILLDIKYKSNQNIKITENDIPINNFNSILLNNNINKQTSNSEKFINYSNNIKDEIFDEIKSNGLNLINEDLNNNDMINKSRNSPLNLSADPNPNDSSRLTSLNQGLDNLKKPNSTIIEKNKKINEENNCDNNSIDKQNGLEENLKNIIAQNAINNHDSSNLKIDTSRNKIYEAENILIKDEENSNIKNKSNLTNINNFVNLKNDFIKIVDDENIQKSNEKDLNDYNLNIINKNIDKNFSNFSDYNFNTNNNKNSCKSIIKININPQTGNQIISDSNVYENSCLEMDYNNKNSYSSIKKSSNDMNKMEKENQNLILDESIKNNKKYKIIQSSIESKNNVDSSITKDIAKEFNNNENYKNDKPKYRPHFTTPNNFHKKIHQDILDENSININNYNDNFNYTYTTSKIEALNSPINNLNMNLNSKFESIQINRDDKLLIPNDNINFTNKFLTAEKKRKSDIKIIKIIKKDSIIKVSNNPSISQNQHNNSNQNRNLSARKSLRNIKSKNIGIIISNVNNSTINNKEKIVNENKLKIFKSNPNFSNVKITNIIKKIKNKPNDDDYNSFNQTNNTINNFNVTCFENNQNTFQNRNENLLNKTNVNFANENLNNTINGIYNEKSHKKRNKITDLNRENINTNINLKKANVSKSKKVETPTQINKNYNSVLNNTNLIEAGLNVNEFKFETDKNSQNVKNKLINQNNDKNIDNDSIKQKYKNAKSNINIEEDISVNESRYFESNISSDDCNNNISGINQIDNISVGIRDSSKVNQVNLNHNVVIYKNNNTINKNLTKLPKFSTINLKNFSNLNNNTTNKQENDRKSISNIKLKKDKNEVRINYMITPKYCQNQITSSVEKSRINDSKEKISINNSTTNRNSNFANKNEGNNEKNRFNNFSNNITTNLNTKIPNDIQNEILNKISNNKNIENNKDENNQILFNENSSLNNNNSNIQNNPEEKNSFNNPLLKNNLNLRNVNTTNLLNNNIIKKSSIKNLFQNTQLSNNNRNSTSISSTKLGNNNNSNKINFLENTNRIKNRFNENKRLNIHSSTGNLVLEKCIENLRTALDNYMKASRTDKDLLKNIIRDNLSNIKKENELQKSLHKEYVKNDPDNPVILSTNQNKYEYESETSNNNSNKINEDDLGNENVSPIFKNTISDRSKEKKIIENINNNNEYQFMEGEENNKIFDENEFNKLSDDPEDIKNFIINQLESFKLGLVKDRLEKYFEKIRDETSSPRSVFYFIIIFYLKF